MPEVWEGKHYENYESINFDEYMSELGECSCYTNYKFYQLNKKVN